MNINVTFLSKMLINQIQEHIKKINLALFLRFSDGSTYAN